MKYLNIQSQIQGRDSGRSSKLYLVKLQRHLDLLTPSLQCLYHSPSISESMLQIGDSLGRDVEIYQSDSSAQQSDSSS